MANYDLHLADKAWNDPTLAEKAELLNATPDSQLEAYVADDRCNQRLDCEVALANRQGKKIYRRTRLTHEGKCPPTRETSSSIYGLSWSCCLSFWRSFTKSLNNPMTGMMSRLLVRGVVEELAGRNSHREC